MSETVFLHYTKAELDRNFDQRGWVPNALEVIGRYADRAKVTQERLTRRKDLRYGPGKDELLDFFPAVPGGPVEIFVHGGAWKNFTKDDFSFPAEPYVAAGINTAVINFSKLPDARLPQVVDQVSRAIEWVGKNVKDLGGDPNRIYLSAHSSGAHISAMALTTDWTTRGLPKDIVKGAVLMSGPYDLRPVPLSARSSYVELTPEEIDSLSPQKQAHRINCPVIAIYAEGDTDEFQRQSREFAEALKKAGKLSYFARIPGFNHFELMETYGDADSEAVRLVKAQVFGHPL